MPPHVRCVVLVIAHRHPSYAPFRRVWDDHWDGAASRRCYFLYNDPAAAALPVVDPRGPTTGDLVFPFEETYPAPGLLLKTLGAIDCLAAAGLTYDFLLRTNLSSLFDWEALDALLDAAPRHAFLAGTEYQPRSGNNWKADREY